MITDPLPPLEVTPARRDGPPPLLSILVPTRDHDIRQLAAELLAGMAALPRPAAVELLVLIDGNPALAGQQEMLVEAAARRLAAGLCRAPCNLGRAEARNTLARLARGDTLLFLDADSLPDSPDFVARALAAAGEPAAVICGGRTSRRLAPPPRDARLFHLHSAKREWLPAVSRNRDPAGHFISANFQVGRAAFLATPFDARFKGWGWEDTEWALRIAGWGPIRHIDNTVSHMEHHRDADWLGRLDRSAGNYLLLCQAHPDAVRRHRLFPLIRTLRPIAGWGWLQRRLLALALAPALPAGLRLRIAKFRQALVYGRSVGTPD